MNRIKIILPIIGMLLVMFACQHEHTNPSTHNPVMTVAAPNAGMYHNGDTIPMYATLTDEDDLHEAYFSIWNAGDSLFYFQPYVHGLQTYTLDSFYVVNGISVSSAYTFTAIGLNHADGGDTVNVAITVAP